LVVFGSELDRDCNPHSHISITSTTLSSFRVPFQLVSKIVLIHREAAQKQFKVTIGV
jgi:hypothetical protein